MEFKTKANHGSGGGNRFLKLKDGESVVGVFRGEIYEFHTKWVNGKSLPAAADDPEAKTRFRANIVINENGKPMAKIFEFAYPVFEQMAMINKKRGDITKIKIDISRIGEGTQTKYILMPSADPVNLRALDNIELHILNKNDEIPRMPLTSPPPGWDDYPPPGDEFSEPTDNELPF